MRVQRAVALLLPAVLAATSLAAAPATYTVVELGAPAGSTAQGLSPNGQVTGTYFAAGGARRAFVWNAGQLADVGTLGGITQTFSINDDRFAVGYSVDAQGRQRAIRGRDGAIHDLGTLRRGVHAAANDINRSGWVVGMSQRKSGNEMLQRAALWRNGTVLDLGTFGGEFAEAFGLNDAGQVVGWAWTIDRRQRAFRWSEASGLIELGTLGGLNSIAAEISNTGVVVGHSDIASGSSTQRAFRWSAGSGMQELPSPAGVEATAAVAVNSSGLIVGVAYFGPDANSRGLLWAGGQVYFLDELLGPASDWIVIQSNDINEAGRIAAVARRPGESYRAVVLVPQEATN